MRVRPATAVVLAAVLTALSGCGSSPKSLTLTLDPVSAATVYGDYRGPPIAVPAVHVPAAIDRVEFVRETVPGRLDVDDFARWSAPLGVLARDALVRDLTQRLPAGAVLPPGAGAAAGHAIAYDVTILGLSTGAGGGTMQAAYRRLPGGTTRIGSYTSTTAGVAPVDAAGTLSTLIGKLADDVAADAARPR